MRDRFFELMKAAGMPHVVAATYCELLSMGAMNLSQLARTTGEREPDVATATSVLRSMRLVGTDRNLFYATEPSLAWLALVVDQAWRRHTTLIDVHNISTFGDAAMEKYRILCGDIAAEASELYKPYNAVKKHRELDVHTLEELSFFTCESIFRAEREIVAVSKSPRSPQLAEFWTILTDRITRYRVRYRRIADLDEVEAHGLAIVTRDRTDYDIDLRILERDRIRHEFYAIDNKVLVVAHKPSSDAVGTPRRGVGRVTNYLDIVRRYTSRFERYERDAIPGDYVVQRLTMAAQQLISRARMTLEPFMVSWLQELVSYGKFTTFHIAERWPHDKRRAVEETSIRLGFARRNPYGELVPCYGVTEIQLRVGYQGDSARETGRNTPYGQG